MESKGTTIFGVSLPVPNVQELAKEPLKRVPPRYTRPDQDSPIISSLTSSRPQLPIIDMERLSSKDYVHSEVEKLHLACRDWGFFQLINHGVSCALLEKLKEETQEFFKLPLEEKKMYVQKLGDAVGLGQAFVISEEQKLDWCDILRMITLPHDLRKPHLLPKLPHAFRDAIEEYSKEVEKVALKTLMFMAKALKMDDQEMKLLFSNGLQYIRMNYYPPCPQPEQFIGITPHRKIISNGECKSIEHLGVVNADKERISIGTFINPNLGMEIGPALSLVTPAAPARFTRIAFADYLKNFYSRKLNSKSNIEQYYI